MKDKKRGYLEVIEGSMFSGKSEELIRRARRATIAKQTVRLFKPSLDNRYVKGHVNSHDGNSAEAEEVENAMQILERLDGVEVDVIAIDEAQFFDDEIVRVCNGLADKGYRVIAAGLDTDFRGDPFGPMPALIATADKSDKLHAICVVCGEEASRTQRMVIEKQKDGSWITRVAYKEEPLIVVAAGKENAAEELDREDYYEARCRQCHDVPNQPNG